MVEWKLSTPAKLNPSRDNLGKKGIPVDRKPERAIQAKEGFKANDYGPYCICVPSLLYKWLIWKGMETFQSVCPESKIAKAFEDMEGYSEVKFVEICRYIAIYVSPLFCSVCNYLFLGIASWCKRLFVGYEINKISNFYPIYVSFCLYFLFCWLVCKKYVRNFW